MRALKVKLYQTQAVYRNPISSEVIETYPLPPPSTVLGLLSTILKRSFGPNEINISIAGTYDNLIRDYQWYKKHTITKPYPILVHALSDVRLILHITAYDDSKLLSEIQDVFEHPPSFLYLGRAEDLLKIESVKLVDITEKKFSSDESIILNHPTYVSGFDQSQTHNSGIPYWLATFLHQNEITVGSKNKQETKMIRNFDWILYHYFEKNSTLDTIEDSVFYFDGDDFISWSLPNLNH